jgi:hypothetical protein
MTEVEPPEAGEPVQAGEHSLRAEIWREGITMALYISLSQLAVMTALPTAVTIQDEDLALTTLLTSLGLILAHQLAFRMSSRLVAEGSRLHPEAPRLLRAQLVGGGLVTLLAVLPIWLFGPEAYRVSIFLLLAFVLGVGYLVARTTPVSRLKALIYVAFVAVLVLGVLAVKSLVSH